MRSRIVVLESFISGKIMINKNNGLIYFQKHHIHIHFTHDKYRRQHHWEHKHIFSSF